MSPSWLSYHYSGNSFVGLDPWGLDPEAWLSQKSSKIIKIGNQSEQKHIGDCTTRWVCPEISINETGDLQTQQILRKLCGECATNSQTQRRSKNSVQAGVYRCCDECDYAPQIFKHGDGSKILSKPVFTSV